MTDPTRTSSDPNRVHQTATRVVRAILCTLACTAVLALGLGAGSATPVSALVHLDPTFGGGKGWVSTSTPRRSTLAYGTVVQPDGKIVVSGQATDTQGNSQLVVVRYRSNGSRDASFGVRGTFISHLPVGQSPFLATSVKIQGSSGKVVLGGWYGQGALLVMRLTSNGHLDRSFGAKRRGYSKLTVGGGSQAIALTSTGSILVGASNSNVAGRPMVVAKYTPSGHLDRRFGVRGVARIMFWDPVTAASAGVAAISVGGNGQATIMGHLDYIGGDGHGSAGLVRLTSSGKVVRSFGTNGHKEVAFPIPGGGYQFWFPCAMTTDAKGRATITGDGTSGTANAMLTARVTGNGKTDKSYGPNRDGLSILPGVTDGQGTTCGASATPSGGITVGIENLIVQLTSTGRPDKSFAKGGVATISKPANVYLNAVSAYVNDRFVTAGSVGNYIYVARYRRPGMCVRSLPSSAAATRGC